MNLTQDILLDLESELEQKARLLYQEDVRMSRIRLLGYLDGLSDMRIALSRCIRKENNCDIVQESEVEKDGYDMDLIRVIVEMHKEVTDMHEKVKAILLLLKQIDFLGGNENAGEIFGKDA